MNKLEDNKTKTDGVPKTTSKKKQVELSDDDFTKLLSANFSNSAWEIIARKHSFELGTQDRVSERVYLATHKAWPKQEPKKGGILTSKGFKYTE
jgi:hypothetical protein